MSASSGMVPCVRCGDFVDAASALLSDAGEPICNGCNDRAEIDVGEQRAATAIFATSGSALGFGLIASVVNPYLIMTVLGVATALGTFSLLVRHPELRARLGWRLPVTIVVACIGLLSSLGAPLLLVLFQLL